VREYQKQQIRDIKNIFESLKPEIKSDLERLKYRLQTVYRESKTYSARDEQIDAEVRKALQVMIDEMHFCEQPEF
jgi:hypothetical protein